jgi:hypothetical protein
MKVWICHFECVNVERCCVRGNCVGMARPFEGPRVKSMQSILDINEVDDLKLFQPPFKLPRREKQLQVLVELIHLSTMAISYNHHFANYSK